MSIRKLATIVGLTAIMTVSTQAQEIASGEWPGEMQGPNGQSIPLAFTVSNEDSLTISMAAGPDGQLGTYSLENIELEGRNLRFELSIPGTDLECWLRRKSDGGFNGECTDDSGEEGVMTMNPPGSES